MRIVYLRSFLAVSLVFGQTTKACTAPRIRRPWSQLSQTDKNLYIKAVALGMQKGYHQRFVEIHMEPASNWEAHDVFFFYWHRAFLLGYENMLRSLGNEFACITIPYWDYAALGAKFISGSCSNMLTCGPLLQDFGGSTPRGAKALSMTVNGAAFQTDNCVSSSMTQNFCQSTSAFNTGKCLKCMPRNDWSKVQVPPDVNVLNVFNNIMGNVPATLDGVTEGIQYGTHNMVHAVLDSVMGTFASPGDPVFYSHHAAVDAFHAIYYKCIVASNPPSNKAKDARTWSQGRNYVGRTITATDKMTMKVGETGTTATSIWTAKSNPIYPFFQNLPQTYLAYSDITKLDAFSYSYDFLGTMLSAMNTQCTSFKPGTSMFLSDDGVVTTPQTTIDAVSQEIQWLAEATELASKFYTEDSDINYQVQIMLCVYYNECLGGVFDYSEEFKTNFRVTKKPPCKRIIDQLANGDIAIGVAGWEKVMLKNYPCNSPSHNF
ncbi:hypothetical protein THRCLA_05855 [Thraustotheca clavata]|uniref:Tyrosinase copper-binding domain-containing protein n=1 Tax=Thraustotheca clavata TaxID=74557 RepID=A0A1V9ZS86_9STRA|nr:hypothetical protein THRCLA_05855 [Thraustotheca clavata]